MSTIHRAQYIDGHWYVPVEDFHEVRDALNMAVYHAENLNRLRYRTPVRDFPESLAGFEKAKALSDQLEGRNR